MIFPKVFSITVTPAHLIRLLLPLFIVLLCCCPQVSAQTDPAYFDSLQKKLIKDGFDTKTIQALYKLEDVQFDFDAVSRYFVHQEGKLNYDQFTEKEPIEKAREYLETHAAVFKQVETDTGVDPKAITAILLVETRLGTYFGSGSILNTLSTMASLEEPWVLEAFWKKVPAKRRLERSAFEKKAATKSGWAYKELKALLNYAKREDMAPEKIIGSYAGAMGIAQFMPSNALTLAVDGNQDGRVDLFDHPDAIASVASYLKRYGWKPNIKRKAAYDVIMHYNHSSYYANTVLKIIDKLGESGMHKK
jgi:membrane-bound lytic murein transglycosylase B